MKKAYVFVAFLLLTHVVSAQKKYKSSFQRDSIEFYKLQTKFSDLMQKVSDKDCCFEDSTISKSYKLFYGRINEFMTISAPGHNLDTIQTRQIVFCVEKITYMIEKSYTKGWKIDSKKFARRVGFFPSEHGFFLDNAEKTIVDVERLEKDD